MKHYVIRAYRRNPGNLYEVDGIVEKPATCMHKSFHDMDGLMDILGEFTATDSHDHTSNSQTGMRGPGEALANA